MFSRNRPDRDDRAAFSRRLNRMDFWAATGLYILLTLATFHFVGGGRFAMAVAVTCLTPIAGRLKDLGHGAGWAMAVPILFVTSIFFLQRHPLLLGLDVSLMGLTLLIAVAYVGFTPGDPGPNAFGAPPVGYLNAAFARRAARRAVRP